MIVACYHPLPLPACMLYFDLVSIPFGTSLPTSFNILVKMFLHLFHWFLMCVVTCLQQLVVQRNRQTMTKLTSRVWHVSQQ